LFPYGFGVAMERVEGGRFFRGVIVKVEKKGFNNYMVQFSVQEFAVIQQAMKEDNKLAVDIVRWLVEAGITILRLTGKRK